MVDRAGLQRLDELESGQSQQAERTVLATLDREACDQRGRGAPEVDVAAVQIRLVRRRVARDQPRCVGRELEHAVAPVGLPVVMAVSRRDEQVARRRVDDRSGASPDRGTAFRAGRGPDQSSATAA